MDQLLFSIVCAHAQAGDMSVENMVSTYQPHGILVVMAVDDFPSFQLADDMLNFIRDSGYRVKTTDTT